MSDSITRQMSSSLFRLNTEARAMEGTTGR